MFEVGDRVFCLITNRKIGHITEKYPDGTIVIVKWSTGDYSTRWINEVTHYYDGNEVLKKLLNT